ncbi:hypothetical protein T439DRAFT_376931 [Meredithblackwellia eburnea MCA 4105]
MYSHQQQSPREGYDPQLELNALAVGLEEAESKLKSAEEKFREAVKSTFSANREVIRTKVVAEQREKEYEGGIGIIDGLVADVYPGSAPQVEAPGDENQLKVQMDAATLFDKRHELRELAGQLSAANMEKAKADDSLKNAKNEQDRAGDQLDLCHSEVNRIKHRIKDVKRWLQERHKGQAIQLPTRPLLSSISSPLPQAAAPVTIAEPALNTHSVYTGSQGKI